MPASPAANNDRASSTANTVVKAVVPAAGLGSRMQPLTRAIPKELLPVGREPVLSYVATELREAGITDALFIVSEGKPQIRAFFGDVYEGDRTDLPPLHCAYTTQAEQKGSGDALLYAEEWAGNAPFVVAFGDCIIEGERKKEKGESTGASALPLARLLATHVKQGAEATVLVEAVEWAKVSRYGVVAPRQALDVVPINPFALADIVEKPCVEDAPSNWVIAARWVLQPSVFALLRQSELDARGERNITDAVRALGQAGKPLWAVPLRGDEARRDIGSFESFFTQFIRAAMRDAEFGHAVRQAAREELERQL